MTYFASLPQLIYTIGDQERLVTNILVNVRRRAGLEESGMFEDYTIADGDSPEIVADKLYGHTKWWWVVMLVAGIVKPDQWPLADADVVKMLERAYGDDYQTAWLLTDENGSPAPVRTRMTFEDEDGNVINWHEHGEGLGAERYGVIHMRGVRKYLEDEALAANDAKRKIQVLQARFLNDFVEDFRARLNNRVADGMINF